MKIESFCVIGCSMLAFNEYTEERSCIRIRAGHASDKPESCCDAIGSSISSCRLALDRNGVWRLGPCDSSYLDRGSQRGSCGYYIYGDVAFTPAQAWGSYSRKGLMGSHDAELALMSIGQFVLS